MSTTKTDGWMTVTVRDRSAEPKWGHGLTRVATRKITIPATCPQCGGPRGEPRGMNQCEDGVFYWTQVWDNPCGHVDYYADVIAEAQLVGALSQAVTR